MTITLFKKASFNLLLLTTVLLSLSSCKKEKDLLPGNQGNGTLLQEFRNGDEQINFFYDNSGRVNKVRVKGYLHLWDDILEFQVHYKNNQIEKLTSSFSEQITPVYENGKMIRADYTVLNNRFAYTNFYYDGNNLTRATVYQGGGNNYEPYLGFDFSYNAAGNISRTEAFMATGTPGLMRRAGHVDFTYDAKSNPLYQHRQLLWLFWQNASANNTIQEDHFDGQLISSDRYVYTYTYKANGLPDKATIAIGLPGDPPGSSLLSYLYQ